MLRLLTPALLAFLLATTAPAQTAPAKPKPKPAASARAQLQGTWQATDDPKSVVVITANQYIERYEGKVLGTRKLTVQNRPCDPATPAENKPGGDLYLNTDDACYYVISVSATKLEISMIGGRGNTLSYRRMPAKK